MGPLVIALKNSDVFETKVSVTGQHREMLEIPIFDCARFRRCNSSL